MRTAPRIMPLSLFSTAAAVAAHTGTTQRSGTISIAGQNQTLTHVVTQAAPTPVPGPAPKKFAFAGPPVAIPDNDPAGVNIPLAVNGMGAIASMKFSIDGTATSA